ncbi:hypothetical protein FQZ97_749650 [compost metagenome]
MYQFQSTRMSFLQVDAGNAGVMYLFKELLERAASFMVYKCFLDQSCFESIGQDTDTHINIFAKTDFSKAPGTFKYFFGVAHIKTSGKKFIHFLPATTNATCCNNRGHGVIDGFLKIRKIFMCRIRTAKCIYILMV